MGFGSAKLLLTLAVRNVWRNPRRSILTLLAIAVGVWSVLSLAALSRGLSQQIIRDSIRDMLGHIQIHAENYLSDPAPEHSFAVLSTEQQQLLQDSRIKAWSSRVKVPAVIMSERKSTGVNLIGIDPEQEKQLSFIGDGVNEGVNLSSPADSGIVIGKALADDLQTRLGKRVVVVSHARNKKVADRGFRIVGLYRAELQAMEKAYAFIGRETAQKMLKMENMLSEVSLVLNATEETPVLLNQLQQAFPGLDVQSWRTLAPITVSMVDLQDGFIFLWGLIVFTVIAFGLINTQFMAIFERTREFGLFQALGMKSNAIILQVLLESLVLLVIGAVVGNLINIGCLELLKGGIDISQFAQGAERVGISSVIYPYVKTADVVVANALIAVLGFLSGLYPAWRAARHIPIEAITRT